MPVKKLYWSVLFFLLFPFMVMSQKAMLQGTVRDAQNGQTLPGVTIIFSAGHGTVTNSDGQYSAELSPGEYDISFRFVGYKEHIEKVVLTAGDKKIVDVQLREEARMLDAVVVSAGKFEQKLSDVTVSMEVMKADFIENNNLLSLEEGLQKIPGLTIMDDQPSVRGGSGYSYGAGSRVLFLVDDIPMLTGASGEARWDFVPIENVQQVEIIKGASSALYGSSALNGVINYRSSYPGLVPQTKITSLFGMYDDPERDAIKWWGNYSPIYAGTRFFHSRQMGQFDITFGGHVSSDNSYRENETEERYRLNGQLRYRDKKVKGLSYTINANFMRRIGDIFLLWLDGDSGVYRASPSYQQEINNSALNVYPSVIWMVNDSTRHSLKTRLYRIRNRNNTQQSNFDDLYYAEYNYQRSWPSKSFTWTNGIAGTYNESVSEIYGDLKHFGSSLGFFSQADRRFNRLNVSLGGRIEGYRIDDDELKFKPVFRTGVNYSISERAFVRASVGMGYRYPTIAERYTATSTGSLKVFPNPELQPETGYSSELGFKQGFSIFDWVGYFDAAVFYTRYENMIEFMFGYQTDTFSTNPFDPNYFLNCVGFKAQNVRNAEISGFEVILTGEGNFMSLPASLLLGYTYTNPIDLDANQYDSLKTTGDNILKYRFYHSAKVDFEVGIKKLTLGANVEYQSHIVNIDKAFEDPLFSPTGDTIIMYGEPIYILPGLKEYREKNNKGFIVADLRIGWNINPSVHVSFTAKNILNREYMIRPGDIQPPRTFILQLALKV